MTVLSTQAKASSLLGHVTLAVTPVQLFPGEKDGAPSSLCLLQPSTERVVGASPGGRQASLISWSPNAL